MVWYKGYVPGLNQCPELRTTQFGRSKTLDHFHAHHCQKKNDVHGIQLLWYIAQGRICEITIIEAHKVTVREDKTLNADLFCGSKPTATKKSKIRTIRERGAISNSKNKSRNVIQ